mmetsp:Transcript_16906/g.21391  ORF Transcript_16906/g.21391 Transcript_16906/m.21391 type:complete len:555 (-) Transcript_16906:177-1841(-)|eukprot:CAMPEP_0203694954 /NCGR_PEP_ID=MMETSP0091-20130426/6550_1 /ASSEMBLY_ACC=CAM_ASM_001089 /TAXON_ID=426623 /ORGANISM="Chaetoceros affinis, Strain CCMP159" /LENGTH=554 /DNA_ID=CAMNT_0050566407 /DNA_START=76 /DNA_END=1740 /DNA_ORIENTATION=-
MMIPQNYYSSTAHVRNRRRDLKGNVLTYTVPGLKKPIDIPFPDRKLPVCKRCKKIYKTRELCRIRDGHTDIPWNTTYICITMDESCFTRNTTGDMRLKDEDAFQFNARSITGPPMPYRSKVGTLGGTKAPICMACKDKNYTRHHCREKQQHQQLPWNTVYVMLSAAPTGYGGGGYPVEDEPRHIGSKRSSSSLSSCEDRGVPKKMKSDDSSDTKSLASEGGHNEHDHDVNDDSIHNVQTSRAFLLVVGKDACKFQWLEIDPLVPRPNSDFSGTSWENNENLEPMYPAPGPMMMNNMSGNFPHPSWQGFNPSQGPGKFHPMMVMGNPNGNFSQCGPPGFPTSAGGNSVSSDNPDRYSPNTTSSNGMRINDRPSSGYQGYEPNFGMNGPMGPGMMNGPGNYNNPPGMLCQPSYSDDRDSDHKSNFSSQSQKNYYDGPNMGNMSNNMMSMNRNFNEYNNGMNSGMNSGMNNSSGQFMPMQQGGYSNGPDFYRRNSAGPSFGGNGGPPFPPNGRPMDQLPHPSQASQQQGGMYQPPQHPAEQPYSNGPSKNNKPPVLI